MKRGRPRENRPARDLGTPELRFKKMAAVKGGDISLSEHPMGILLARNWCDQREYDAAILFGVTWGKIFNPGFAKSLLTAMIPGSSAGNWSDDELREANEKLILIRARLNARQLYDALVNCVVYRRVNLLRIGALKSALRLLVEIDRENRRTA